MFLGDLIFGLLPDHFFISKKKITSEDALVSTKDATNIMTFVLLRKKNGSLLIIYFCNIRDCSL